MKVDVNNGLEMLIVGLQNATYDIVDKFNRTTAAGGGNRSFSSIRNVSRSTGNSTAVEMPMSLQILNWLNIYYLGTIAIVGVLGNAKNVVCFIRSRKDLRSPSYYLASLALVDVIFLAIILILWLGQHGIDLYSWDGIYEMFFFLSSASSCMSGTFNWIKIVFMSRTKIRVLI